MKSFGNTRPNIYKDINLLKIKMDFDIINQKINNMENIIQSLNEQDINMDETKDKMNQIYLKDKIRHKNELSKNYQNYLNIKKSFENLEYNQNNFSTHHNYSSQNIKKERYSHNLINDCINRNSFYSNYNSLQNEKSKTLDKAKYSSCNNLNELILKNRPSYNEKENIINNKNKKSFYSLNKTNIPNQKKIIQKKLIINNNFFDKINKITNKNNYKNKTQNISLQLKKIYNNLIFNEKIINNIEDEINRNNSEYFGPFDDYFLSDNEQIYKNKTERNQNNNKIIKVNVLQKRPKNKNGANFNIYNIIKNDKIIQNNYYGIKRKQAPVNNSNLIIENQNSLSFFINNKNELDNNCQNNSDDKSKKKELNRNKFNKNQLQKCLSVDLFIPNKIQYEIKNSNIINEKNDNQIKDKSIKKIVKNHNENNNNNIGRYKDDFYYDLYAEKVLDITKVNNSYDEIHLLPRIKKKYNDKFNNVLIINKNKQNNIGVKKVVKFSEGNNRIIKINQKDIASKFGVYNNSGKKIYHQKFNMNNYLKKLKNTNLKIKSILMNKKEEVDNSEWDKLYDIINKIAEKSNNKNNNISTKKAKFNIKNIESFKKNGNKNLKIKNKK